MIDGKRCKVQGAGCKAQGARYKGLKFFQAFVLIIQLFVFAGCRSEKQYYLSQGNIFHTSYHIKYEYDKPLDNEIQAALNRFDLSLNPFNDQSIIYKVNNNEPVEVDSFFVTVFKKAQEVSRITGGAFDITAAPLINVWGFGFSKKDSVSPAVIDSLKQYIGYEKVKLEGSRVVKDFPQVQLNASAIAKGYACDVVAHLLDTYRIQNYLVEIGGEMRAKGKNPNGVCWKIEITKPEYDSTGMVQERQTVVPLCDKGMATSGNYRNFYVKDGLTFGHTINPKTGYPAEQNILSATVIASDCMTADAYATAFMVLGMEAAVELAGKSPDLQYYLIGGTMEGEHKIVTNIPAQP